MKKSNIFLLILALMLFSGSILSKVMYQAPTRDTHRQKVVKQKQRPPIPKKTYKLLPKPNKVYKTLESIRIENLGKNIDSVKIFIKGPIDFLSKEKVKELAKIIKENPLSIIKSIGRHVNPSYNTRIFESDTKLEEAYKLAKEDLDTTIKDAVKTKYPEIFLFYECDVPHCKLSRSKTDKRTKFENKIVDQFQPKKILHLSIASGDLFPDLRILVKQINKGKKIEAVHLIDTKYADALEILKKIYKKKKKNPYEISIDDIMEQLQSYIRYIRTDPTKLEQFDNKLFAVTDILRFAQLARILFLLSDQEIPIYIHKNIKEYLKFVGKKPKLKANFVFGMDFFPEDMPEDLQNLRKNGVKKDALIGEIYKDEVIRETIIKKPSAPKPSPIR